MPDLGLDKEHGGGFVLTAAAALVVALWAWFGRSRAPAAAEIRQVSPAWWIAIAVVLALTLALARC